LSDNNINFFKGKLILDFSKIFFIVSFLSILFIEVLFFHSTTELQKLKRNAYFDENFYWLSLSAEAELGRLGFELLAQVEPGGAGDVENLRYRDATEFRLLIAWSRLELLTTGNFGKWSSGDPVAASLVEDIVGLVRSLETNLAAHQLSASAASEILDTAVLRSKELTQAALEMDRATKDRVFDAINRLRTLTTFGTAIGLGSVMMLAFFAVGYIRMIQRERVYIDHINRMLTDSVQEREYFIKVASHELRNSAQVALARLDRDWTTDGRIRAATIDAMIGFRENVDSLLDFARSISGRVNLIYSEIDVQQSLQAWIDAANRENEKTVILETSSIDHLLSVERTVLFRCFQNIFINALRHARSKVQVCAEISEDGCMLKVRVQDDGAGISKNVLADLSLLQTARKESEGNLGLGLLVVKELILSVNGRLKFLECDTGTAVEIIIPINRNNLRSVNRNTYYVPDFHVTLDNTASHSKEGILKILYCEDSSEIREAFFCLLEKKYGDVHQCGSLREFSQISHQETYDVAVLDYDLGDGSALDVVKQLKRNSPYCKVIVLTGIELREIHDSHLVDRVLKKPIQFQELVQTIDSFPHQVPRALPVEN